MRREVSKIRLNSLYPAATTVLLLCSFSSCSNFLRYVKSVLLTFNATHLLIFFLFDSRLHQLSLQNEKYGTYILNDFTKQDSPLQDKLLLERKPNLLCCFNATSKAKPFHKLPLFLTSWFTLNVFTPCSGSGVGGMQGISPDYVSQHSQLVEPEQYSNSSVFSNDIFLCLVVEERNEEAPPASHLCPHPAAEWNSSSPLICATECSGLTHRGRGCRSRISERDMLEARHGLEWIIFTPLFTCIFILCISCNLF